MTTHILDRAIDAKFPPMGLNRTLGLPMLTFYGTGMILGAGIYSIIGKAAGIAGPGLWQGFLLAAFASLLTALSYAELATMFPTAGGEYIYLRSAFKNQCWMAASLGLIVTFAGCASAATVAVAFAGYLQQFVEGPPLLVALALLIFFTGVNIVGIKQSTWINAIFTLIEVSGLVLFIWLGLKSPDFGKALRVVPGPGVVSSAALIVFAYLGFENIVNLAEEAKSPEKNIPRAILLSLLISTILYVLVSLAAVALMPPEQLANTDTALTDAAMKSSASLAGVLGGIALFSTANTALIALITTSRVLYGISKDGSLPKALSQTLSKRQTPWVAALVALFVASLILPLGQVEVLAGVASFSTMIAFLAVNATLITLRKTQPRTKRPFKVPLSIAGVPVLPLLAIACCLVFLFQFDRIVHLIGLGAFAGSTCLYFLFRASSFDRS
jgi:basic amino acid/polyamine antiporter, APA family